MREYKGVRLAASFILMCISSAAILFSQILFKLEALCGLLANKTLFKIRELAAYDCNLCGERTLINYPFRHNASNLTFLIARKAKKTPMINCYILPLMANRISFNVCMYLHSVHDSQKCNY